MSGGEQQMLAIARAMIANPDLIMLDEPSEGIMPVLVDEMFALFRAMKAEGHDDSPGRAERGIGARYRRPRLRAGPGRGRVSGRRERAAGRQRDQGALLLGMTVIEPLVGRQLVNFEGIGVRTAGRFR